MPTFAVASGHPLTSQAAANMIQQGGNAYDAVLAAMMMSFVAEPLLSSPGGGGLMLAGPMNQQPTAFDFFANTPLNKQAFSNPESLDFYPIYGDFGDRQQEFHIGAASCAVPLAVAGIFAIHKQLASLPLTRIAQAAIQAAKDGVVVNEQQAFVAQILNPIIESNANTKSLFGGLKTGRVWKNPQLAAFLDTLSNQDSEWFYQGEVAQTICQQTGVLLTENDFSRTAVSEQPPLNTNLNGHHIFTAPQPSTGGQYVIDQLLAQDLNPKTAVRHSLAMQAVNMKKFAAETARGTSHISVVDGQGNLASMTLSNGEGNGLTIPEYGFMLNNFLGEEDINPGGFFNWQAGQKMKTMMAPCLITSAQQRMALGTGGSNRIKSALFQAIDRITKGQSLKQAINAPRLHWEKRHLDIEAGFKDDVIEQLATAHPNHTLWSQPSLYFGGINAVQHGLETLGYADFRRQGCGITGVAPDLAH